MSALPVLGLLQSASHSSDLLLVSLRMVIAAEPC